MTPGGPNRRKYRRIRAPVHCRLAGVDAIRQEPVDISLGGVRILSDDAYPVGAILHLDVFIVSSVSVAVTARVVWIAPSAEGAGARFDVGLAFVDVDPDALQLLQAVLGSGESSPP